MSERFTERQRLLIRRFLRQKAAAAQAGKAVAVTLEAKAGERLATFANRASVHPSSVVIANAAASGHVFVPVAHGRRHHVLGPTASKDTVSRVAQALEAGSAATGAFKSPALPQPHAISQVARQAD